MSKRVKEKGTFRIPTTGRGKWHSEKQKVTKPFCSECGRDVASWKEVLCPVCKNKKNNNNNNNSE